MSFCHTTRRSGSEKHHIETRGCFLLVHIEETEVPHSLMGDTECDFGKKNVLREEEPGRKSCKVSSEFLERTGPGNNPLHFGELLADLVTKRRRNGDREEGGVYMREGWNQST